MQRHAISIKCRAKQCNSSSERQRESQQLPNGQPSCSNSTKWSNSMWPRYGCFENIFSKANARRTDVTNWASRNDILNPDRSTAHFEATPEVNRHSRFSRYRSSRDHSSSAEDRIGLPQELVSDRAVVIQITVTYQS